MVEPGKKNIEKRDIIRVKDQFYILATSSLANEQNRVLKHAETFAIFDHHGDIRPLGFEDHGIYHQGTRFLSRLALRLEGRSPLLLSSTVREDNDLLVVDLTNPDFLSRDGNMIHRGRVHVGRSIFLWEGCYYERIRISNYGRLPVVFSFSLEFDTDYVDIFEVRGMKRKKRGNKLHPVIEEHRVTLAYKGLDGKVRKTCIDFASKPDELSAREASFLVKLDPHQEETFFHPKQAHTFLGLHSRRP